MRIFREYAFLHQRLTYLSMCYNQASLQVRRGVGGTDNYPYRRPNREPIKTAARYRDGLVEGFMVALFEVGN